MRHDRRIFFIALLGGAPGVAAALVLMRRAALSPPAQWTLGSAVVLVWLGAAVVVREQVAHPLHTLSNMLGALREGDFSLRSRSADPDDPLGLAMYETNLLAATLREERLRALESAALLRRVMAEIDVAIFAFDETGALRLVNRQGEVLLGRPAERLLGSDAAELGLAELLDATDASGAPRVVPATFPGGAGRWEVRRGEFRQGGRPHALVLVADLSETLRAEEREAWRRLVRVLSHEINNTLAPVKTIAGSLLRRVRAARARTGDDAPVRAASPTTSGLVAAFGSTEDDFAHGLSVIAERADALARFIGSFAQLTRLPPPQRRTVDVDAWVRRVAALESRVPVTVRGGPALTVAADPDQLDQLLINLVRNAADATLETTAGGVAVWWDASPHELRVGVDDEGPGLAETANLFVPFYSTKPDGSGIGLALARQIAEGHGGTLSLENRSDRRGCRATLVLPR